MKKIWVVSLGILAVCFSSQAFAQKNKVIKISARAVTAKPAKRGRSAWQLVPATRMVYIPSGTTMIALEQAIERTANAAGMKVNAQELAANPIKLRRFEQNAGRYVFGAPALHKKQGLAVLQGYQASIAAKRESGYFEELWNLADLQKNYGDLDILALDIFTFYSERAQASMPRVRMATGMEGVICEIPVNGLKFEGPEHSFEVTPEQYVVFRINGRMPKIIKRSSLEDSLLFEVLE